MKKKKVEQSEFNKKLAEKMEAAGERMIEKMKPTRSEKQREYDRRYQAKKRAQKEAQKAAASAAEKVKSAEKAKAPTDEQLIAELTTETTSKQITPTEPVQKRKNLFEIIKEHFAEQEEIFSTELERYLNDSNRHLKSTLEYYMHLAEVKEDIIRTQHEHIKFLNERLNSFYKKEKQAR